METKQAMTIKGVSFPLPKASILQHINTFTAQTDILRFTELIITESGTKLWLVVLNDEYADDLSVFFFYSLYTVAFSALLLYKARYIKALILLKVVMHHYC